MKISRALGFARPQSDEARNAAQLVWARTGLIGGISRKSPLVPLQQVRDWVAKSDWEPIFALALRTDYGSKDREAMRSIAIALGRIASERSRNALLSLAQSVYWDVQTAACTSLANIGDAAVLEGLRQIRSHFTPGSAFDACVDYLSCRFESQAAPGPHSGGPTSMDEARQAFSDRRFGRARYVLESALGDSRLSTTPRPSDLVNVGRAARFLLAQTCAEMGDTEQAVQLVAPMLGVVSDSTGDKLRRAIADWLWSYLVFSTYDPANDHLYELALDIHVDMVLNVTDAHELIHWIRYLTRWLEHLDTANLVTWIRETVRDAAPGYGEVERGMGYAHFILGQHLSEQLTKRLAALEQRIRRKLPSHLHSVFGGPQPVAESNSESKP